MERHHPVSEAAEEALREYEQRHRETGYPLPDGVEVLQATHPDVDVMLLIHQAEWLIHLKELAQGLHHYEMLGELLVSRGDQAWRPVLRPLLERRGKTWADRGADFEADWSLRLASTCFTVGPTR